MFREVEQLLHIWLFFARLENEIQCFQRVQPVNHHIPLFRAQQAKYHECSLHRCLRIPQNVVTLIVDLLVRARQAALQLHDPVS